MAKAQFGYAVEGGDLPENLTGRQYLELVASIRSCPLRWPCGDLIGRLQLPAWLHLPMRQYSMGTRAKISIAAAMLGGPKLLIFDESLNGLDPLAAWEVKRMILEMTSSGRHAVIVSTHVVEAVPALCIAPYSWRQARSSRAGTGNRSPLPAAFRALLRIMSSGR
jgi:ABC-2 type transport system ATP-binding protein